MEIDKGLVYTQQVFNQENPPSEIDIRALVEFDNGISPHIPEIELLTTKRIEDALKNGHAFIIRKDPSGRITSLMQYEAEKQPRLVAFVIDPDLAGYGTSDNMLNTFTKLVKKE